MEDLKILECQKRFGEKITKPFSFCCITNFIYKKCFALNYKLDRL